MMIAQIGAQIFVGAVVAAITAFINKIIQEKFNFWIILGVVATVVMLYGILIQGVYHFSRWRIKSERGNRDHLLSRK